MRDIDQRAYSLSIVNRTERIKAGITGKTKITDPETGEERFLNLDDTENVDILSPEEARIIFGKRRSKQRTFSEEELKKVHTPGDEFEDLEFLKENNVNIDKLPL